MIKLPISPITCKTAAFVSEYIPWQNGLVTGMTWYTEIEKQNEDKTCEKRHGEFCSHCTNRWLSNDLDFVNNIPYWYMIRRSRWLIQRPAYSRSSYERALLFFSIYSAKVLAILSADSHASFTIGASLPIRRMVASIGAIIAIMNIAQIPCRLSRE